MKLETFFKSKMVEFVKAINTNKYTEYTSSFLLGFGFKLNYFKNVFSVTKTRLANAIALLA